MELLIRIAHKQPVVSTAHVTASQRGDVIAAMPDGHAWSDAERTFPEWIIITAEITEDDVESLMEAGREGEPPWRRRIGVEVDGLVPGVVLTREELVARYF